MKKSSLQNEATMIDYTSQSQPTASENLECSTRSKCWKRKPGWCLNLRSTLVTKQNSRSIFRKGFLNSEIWLRLQKICWNWDFYCFFRLRSEKFSFWDERMKKFNKIYLFKNNQNLLTGVGSLFLLSSRFFRNKSKKKINYLESCENLNLLSN